MSRVKTGPTWRMIIVYILLIGLALYMLVGCGVRQVENSNELSKIVNESKDTSKGQVLKESSQSEGQTSKDQNAIVNEKQKQIITELFNENGSLKSRITELESTRMEDKSSKENKSLKTIYNRVDSNFNNTLYKYITITEHKKVKSVVADKSIATNFGGSWPLIMGIIIVVAAVFLYFYLKNQM